MNEVGAMLRGEEIRQVPLAALHWSFVFAARHGWRAVLRVLRPIFRRPGCEAALALGKSCHVYGTRDPAALEPGVAASGYRKVVAFAGL